MKDDDEGGRILLSIGCDHTHRDNLKVFHVPEQIGLYKAPESIAIEVKENGRSNSIHLRLDGEGLKKLTEMLNNLKANLLILEK